MALLLYINGQLADLDAGTTIAQTKQVNDLNSLDNRQTNYTNKFKLPKTANNLRIMQFLTLPGNISAVPYQKNECSLYSHTGECFVYKGWAVVTDGGDSYEVAVYDGIIDLYKAIENKTLADLGDRLLPLNHGKDIYTVQNTWEFNNTYPYRYMLADYNGITGNTANGEVNIDYLIPSVKISYLWENIFGNYGSTYSGSVFDSQNFKNLWITYPKGVNTSENDTLIFESSEYTFRNASTFTGYWNSFWLQWATADTNLLHSSSTPKHLKVSENGYYRIQAAGTVAMQGSAKLCYAKNAEPFALPNQIAYPLEMLGINNTPFTASQVVYLNAQESICFFLKGNGGSFRFNDGSTFTLKLVKVTANDMNFTEAFKDLAITDFVKEITHRFGLTAFKDKYRPHYTFLTLQELLQTNETENWSSKFSRKVSENYTYGSYAQRNWFRYSYNTTENSVNDHFLDVANVNLPEAKDVIKSKIYSPENTQSTYLSQTSNVYKFWDKEIKEGTGETEGTVSYKALDKRFYLMRAELSFSPMELYSTAFGNSLNTAFYYRESFYKMSFHDVLQDYYEPVKQILNNALVLTAEIWLTDADVVNFDFKKLYYIEQLSSYFMVNKINNYIPGKVTKCELVRVHYTVPAPVVIPQLYTIQSIEVHSGRVEIYFTNTLGDYNGVIQYSSDNSNWISYARIYSNEDSPYRPQNLASGTHYFRISYTVYEPVTVIQYSNTVSITRP